MSASATIDHSASEGLLESSADLLLIRWLLSIPISVDETPQRCPVLSTTAPSQDTRVVPGRVGDHWIGRPRVDTSLVSARFV